MKVNIITPDKTVYSNEANSVIIPGSEGDLGLLENHSPIICSLRPGLILIYKDDKCLKKIFVNDGILEFSENNAIILTENATDIDGINSQDIKDNIKKYEDVGNEQLAKIEKNKLFSIENQFYN